MAQQRKEMSELVDKFKSIYDELVDAQHGIAEFIREQSEYPYWAHLDASRDSVASFIEDLEYRDDTVEAGSTTIMPAVIGIPESMCADVSLANAKRTQLVELLRDLDKETTDSGISMSKYLLSTVHLPRLNRKSVARHYQVLDMKPDSISYTWSKSITTQKMDVAAAIQCVSRLIGKSRDKDRQLALYQDKDKLMKLSPDEIVARVYRPTPQPKCNIILNGKREGVKTAHLPIFYPAHKEDSLPIVIPLATAPDERPRLKRSDARLEDMPYAPSVRVYRYRTAYTN